MDACEFEIFEYDANNNSMVKTVQEHLGMPNKLRIIFFIEILFP